MGIWIVLWLLAAVLGLDEPKTYCPVSSTLDIHTVDRYFFYPVDIYAPVEKYERENSVGTNCSAIDRSCAADDPRPVLFCKHNCSTSKDFCPVHRTNVIQTIPRHTSDLTMSALCALKLKLMNASEVVNVVVSGGSLTVGACTQGCCAAPACYFSATTKQSERNLCSWSHYLAQWMNNTFPAKVTYTNHALGGRDSGGAVHFFRNKLFPNKKFTSNDLIFLDHSVNDNVVSELSNKYDSNSYLVDELIVQLYSMSEPYSLPTIILLDADPKLHLERPNPSYAAAYKLAANHYDIPVWSYREAMISDYPIQHQSHYYQYLNFNLSRGTHPGWHIHLLMADLYASILLHDLKNTCTDKNVELQLAFRNRTMKDLPAPRSKLQFVCNKKLLSVSYELIEKKVEVVGTFVAIPDGSWQLREDVQGRGSTASFIRQLNSSATIEHDDNAKLVFSLDITTTELLENSLSVSLQMYIGRSYDNGGLAQVSYCGKNINDMKEPFPGGLMNGLWEDKNYRYSLPFKWSPAPFSPTYCEGFEGKHPTIEITHKMVDPELIPAEKQKFNVLDILVCV